MMRMRMGRRIFTFHRISRRGQISVRLWNSRADGKFGGFGRDDGSFGWEDGNSGGKMVDLSFHRVEELCNFPRL